MKKIKEVITEEEREGMKMIQYLQGMVKIDESDERALHGWRSMSEQQRETTRRIYNLQTKK